MDTAKLHGLGWKPGIASNRDWRKPCRGISKRVVVRPIKEGDAAFQAYYKTQDEERRG